MSCLENRALSIAVAWSEDLNNDRFEDVIVLGEQDSHAFKLATNGEFRDFTVASGLKNLVGRDGLLADVDFTGKLDLLTVRPDGQGVRVPAILAIFISRTTPPIPVCQSRCPVSSISPWKIGTMRMRPASS